MADNQHVIVGATQVVAVIKMPGSAPGNDDDAHFLAQLRPIGQHDGSMIALVAPSAIPRLRKLGAEVTVIDNDGNHYAARILAASTAGDLISALESIVSKAKADFAVAQAGGGGNNDGKA